MGPVPDLLHVFPGVIATRLGYQFPALAARASTQNQSRVNSDGHSAPSADIVARGVWGSDLKPPLCVELSPERFPWWKSRERQSCRVEGEQGRLSNCECTTPPSVIHS